MPQLFKQVLHFGLRKLANSTAWKNLKQYGTSLISGLFLKYPPKKKKKKRLVCLYFTVVYMNSIIGVVSHSNVFLGRYFHSSLCCLFIPDCLLSLLGCLVRWLVSSSACRPHTPRGFTDTQTLGARDHTSVLSQVNSL